ncbi:MAG: hypothetical protein VX834_05550, partial [Myxococcota bacterium]|nr:hypothetical protein [Myxococcota bacterium]
MPKIMSSLNITSVLAFSFVFAALNGCAKNNRGHYVDPAELPTGEAVPVANDGGEREDEGTEQDSSNESQDDETPWGDASDSGEPNESAPCAEITAEAQNLYLPVDIIWAIDSSGSMRQEIDLIQERMNGFASFIENSGLDYQIVLIAEQHENVSNTWDVCLPPPLSSVDTCPDEDGPRDRHIRRHVDSFSALEEIRDAFPEYRDVMRAGASVHMVAVSDDESSIQAHDFLTELGQLGHPP